MVDKDSICKMGGTMMSQTTIQSVAHRILPTPAEFPKRREEMR